MNVLFAIFILIVIGITTWGIRALLIGTREKGVIFSSRAVVLRSSIEATMVILPALALIVWLPYRLDFSYKLNPEMSIADGWLVACFIWLVCVGVFVCLHLARAIDRSKREKAKPGHDSAESVDP